MTQQLDMASEEAADPRMLVTVKPCPRGNCRLGHTALNVLSGVLMCSTQQRWEYVHMNQTVVRLKNGREKVTRNGFDRFFDFPTSAAAAAADAPSHHQVLAYTDHKLAKSLSSHPPAGSPLVASGVLDGRVCREESACVPGAYHDQRYGGRASLPEVDRAVTRLRRSCAYKHSRRKHDVPGQWYCGLVLDNDWRVLPDRVHYWESQRRPNSTNVPSLIAPPLAPSLSLEPPGTAWGRARATLVRALCRAAALWEPRGERDGREARAILYGAAAAARGRPSGSSTNTGTSNTAATTTSSNTLTVSIHARRGDRSLSVQSQMMSRNAARGNRLANAAATNSESRKEPYGSAQDIRRLALVLDERARRCGWSGGADFLVHTEATNAEDLAEALADMRASNVEVSFNASITLDFARMLTADVFVAAAFSSLSTVLRALRHAHRGANVVGPGDHAPQDVAGKEDVRLPLRTARWNGAELVFNPGDQATCADFPGLPPRLPTGTAALPFCAEEAQ